MTLLLLHDNCAYFVVALPLSCIGTDIDAQVPPVGTNLSKLIDLFPDLPTTLQLHSGSCVSLQAAKDFNVEAISHFSCLV